MVSPEEIEGRQFQVGLRGYDVEEVRSFLAQVAVAYRTALEELERRRSADPQHLPSPETADGASSYESVGREVAMVLTSAREAADQIKQRANVQVAEIIDAAQRKAFELQMEAQVQADQRMRQLALGSQRLKGAEARLREGLNQLEAVLQTTRFDLDASAEQPPPTPQPSPWRPVTAADGFDG